MTDNTLPVQVAMMGPTRAGKTTLLTAILADGRKGFTGTSVRIGAADTPTEARIQKNDDELKGGLDAGEFRPGSLRGTREVQRFNILVSPGVQGEGVRFEFLDFPGGDLDPRTRNSARWAEVQEFLAGSTALLVPVDTTVFMEASETRHRQEIPRVLRLSAVRDAIQEWAKERQDFENEPSLVIFAPVKCESYFSDNGGYRDASRELFARFREIYEEVIEAAKAELRQVRIAYVPVDSLGCVEVESVRWVRDEEPGTDTDAITPDIEYMVRPGKSRRVLGAVDVLVLLVGQVVEAKRDIQKRDAADAGRRARHAISERDKKRRFWARVRSRLNGTAERRRVLAAQETQEAQRQLRRLNEYDAVLAGLAEQPEGPRVKTL
jgi:hypothetical protein